MRRIKRFSQLWTCRRTCLVALMLMMLTTASANPVDVNEAKKIAKNFLEEYAQENHATKRSSLAKSNELSLALLVTDTENVVVKNNRASSVGDNALLYVFNGINNDCFVIVSGDNNGKQVFAYSTTNAFQTDSLIPATKVLLERYKATVKASRIGASQQEDTQVSALRVPAVVVEPLIKTQWSQEYPYNYQCPQKWNTRCVVGCTNTACAQVMNYWQWPKQPTGKVEWSNIAGDYLRMNLEEKPFDWDAMKKTYLPNDVLTDREIDAISYLMAGVALANGAWFWMNNSSCTPTPFENTALRKNFMYHCSEVLRYQKMDDTQWLQYIKTELDASRPILYAVARIDHAVVLDGYDDVDNVHVNFGWNGDSDGFYSIDGIDNDYYHIDGDDHSYHHDAMIIHIQPNYDGSGKEDLLEGSFPLLATKGFVTSAFWKFGSTHYNYSAEDKCWKDEISGNDYTSLTIPSGYNVEFNVESKFFHDNVVDSLGICSFNEDGTVMKKWDAGTYWGGTSRSLKILNFSNETVLHTISLAYYKRGVWHKFDDFPSISFYVEPLPPLGSNVVIANSAQQIYAYSTEYAYFSVTLKRQDEGKIFFGDVDVQLYKGEEKIRSWLCSDILVPDFAFALSNDNNFTRLSWLNGIQGNHLPPGTYQIKVAVRDYGTKEFRYIDALEGNGYSPTLTVTTEDIIGYERGDGLYITDFRVEGAEHGTYHCWMADDNSYYVKDINNIPISVTLYNSSDKDIQGDSILLGNASGWKIIRSQPINVKAKESVTLKFKGEFSNPLYLNSTYFIHYKRYIPWNDNWVEEQIYDNPYIEYPSINYVGFYNNDDANPLEKLNDDPIINNGKGLQYGKNDILLPSDTKIVSYHDTYLKDATGKIVAQTNWWIGESDKNRILRLDIRDDVPPGDYYISINKSAEGSGWILPNPVYDKTGAILNYPVTLTKNTNIELISDHKNNGVNYSFASGAVLVRGKSMPVRYCISNPNIGTDYEGTIAVFDDIGNKLSDDVPVTIKKKCAEKVFGEIMVTVPADYDRDYIRIYLKEKDNGQTAYSGITRGSGYYESYASVVEPYEAASVPVKDEYVLVRAKSYHLKVGDELPTISYDCFGLDEGITPVWITEPQVSCSMTATDATGVYPVSITAGVSSNINVDAYEGGSIEVDKHILYAAVEDKTITYGDKFSIDDVSIKYDGFIDGDDETSLKEKPKAVLRNVNSDPDDITSCVIELEGGKSDKYNIYTRDGYLTVNKADHKIIWDQNFESVKSGTVIKLNAYATSGNPLEYTTSNPDIAYIYTASEYGDSYDKVVHKEQYLVLRDKGEVVITAYMASTETTSGTDYYKDRYNEAYTPVAKTINVQAGETPADDALVITAKDYTIKYGDDLPTFEYTSSGVTTLNGTPSISCEATKTSPIGTYNIVISKGSVTNNNTTFVNGTLTIEKAPLTITANSYTIKQGEALPAFEATYEGFKNNETSTVLTKQPSITTTATSASAPGDYDISISGAEAQNYEISYVAGKLTITQSDGITMISLDQPVDVYNLQGQKVLTNTTSLEGLPKGVYIINGRKVVVK